MVSAARLKAYAMVAGVFVLGAASGAAASYAYGQRQLASMFDDDAGSFAEHHRQRAFERELGLSAEQREKIRAIHRQHETLHRQLMRDMMQRCGADLDGEMSKVDDEVRAVLDEPQKARFDQLSKKRHQRFLGGHGPQRMMHGDPPPP